MSDALTAIAILIAAAALAAALRPDLFQRITPPQQQWFEQTLQLPAIPQIPQEVIPKQPFL